MKKTLIIGVMALTAVAATAQRIQTVSDKVDCGKVIYEHPVTAHIELQNKGGGKLQISSVHPTCGCTSVEYPKGPIPSGDSFTITATYDARQLGHFNKDIAVYSNASDKPYYLTMTGVVVEEVIDYSGDYPFMLGDLQADVNNIEYDDVSRGECPIKRINIRNNTDKAVSPVMMHLPNYLMATVSPSTIAAGRQGVVTLTLDSRKLRDYGLTQTSVFLGAFPGDRVSPAKEIEVSAVLLPSFTQLTESELANAPQMRLSTETLDLGSFAGKKKRTGVITIENVGRSTLDISALQMYTAGLKVVLNKTSLKPNETATLKITAEAKRLKHARSKPRVLMITNDPMKSKVIINVEVK